VHQAWCTEKIGSEKVYYLLGAPAESRLGTGDGAAVNGFSQRRGDQSGVALLRRTQKVPQSKCRAAGYAAFQLASPQQLVVFLSNAIAAQKASRFDLPTVVASARSRECI
jgi:hypothetical protein